MKLCRTGFLHEVALGLLLALILFSPSGHAVATEWAPGKSAKFIVPFPPGGTADAIARLFASQISQSTGQAIMVESRPGAGTAIGTEAVARATPDGTTLLIMANSFVINPSLRSNLTYNPLTSFEPTCVLVDSPQIIAVNGSSPLRSLREFVAAARARPGELTYGATGPGATQHIAGEMFKRVAKIDLTYVPYPGGAPAATALLGGHVTTFIGNYSEVMEHLSSGKMRALVVMARKRHDAMPDVPTTEEAGYPNMEATAWFGMVAPAKTPEATLARIITALRSALAMPDIKAKLVGQGLYPIGTCGREFRSHLQEQYEIYRRIIKDANIKG